MTFPPYSLYNTERVNEPKERDKNCIHEKHNCLFINYTIRMSVVILKLDGLGGQSHEGSCKEKTKREFQSKRKLKCCSCSWFLEFSKFVK